MTETPSISFTIICIVAAFALSQLWQPAEAAPARFAPAAEAVR